MIIVLLGAPGSGKGTFARLISKDFNLPQISTGDLIRNEISKNSAIGKIFKEKIDNGNFITDEDVLKLLKSRLKKTDCKNGYILDGFPRNVNQAKLLEDITKIDYVFEVKTPIKVILKRIEARRICEKCNKIYSTETYKKKTCEDCGGKLITRKDDSLEIAKKRFEIYKNETMPLIDYYKSKLISVENTKTIKETYTPVKDFLKKKVKKIGCEITH